MTFENVKVGDVLERIFKETPTDAEVTEVKDDEIICRVIVDMPRKMHFNRSDGVHVNGPEFGYLQFK